jgi:asparagine synthase (glutamine-hydrolysing)
MKALRAMEAAVPTLAEKDPGVYVAHLLFSRLGLRNIEIVNARSHWISDGSIEGMIYSEEENSLDEGLREVGNAFVQSKTAPLDALKRFLLKADGEFILLLYNKKSNRILIANDVLGRLPLYYFHDRQILAVARELKFILPFLPKLAFHRLAVMEYVLLGYPFGENTLIEGVGFFPGGSYLIFDLRTGESAKGSYHVLNFVERSRALSRATAISGMRRVFLHALERRVRWTEKNKIIVSLSGGLDSRGVLAGLKKLGCNPTAITLRNDEEGTARDVAKAIGTDVHSIEQHVKCSGLEFDNIVFLKDGLDCGPNIAQVYGTLEGLKDYFGKNMVYYNGVYGGEVLRLGHLPKNIRSFNSMVAYLLHSRNPERYSTDKVARKFGLTREEMAGHLGRHLRAFPEQDIYRKYLQFRI